MCAALAIATCKNGGWSLKSGRALDFEGSARHHPLPSVLVRHKGIIAASAMGRGRADCAFAALPSHRAQAFSLQAEAQM